jgi:MFS transporter, DHA2 family, multidrug resistance protein
MVSWGGSGLCSLFGGAVTTSLGWPWIFWLAVPVAGLALVLMTGTPESKDDRPHGRFDVVGLLFLVAGLVCFNVTLNNGSRWGWTSLQTLVGFGLTAVLLLALIVCERCTTNPLIDPALFARRPYDGAVISNFLLNFSGSAGVYIMLLYVQLARGLTPFHASLLTLAQTATTLLSIRVGKRIGRARGPRLPMVTGCLLAGIGLIAVAQTWIDGATYYLVISAGLACSGLGLGGSATPSTDTAVGQAPPGEAGAASGIYKMSSSLGSSFGVVTANAVVSSVHSSTPASLDQAASLGMLVAAAAAAMAAVAVAWWVARRPTQAPAPGVEHHHVEHQPGRVGAHA